jgi:DNA-binding SARP family transcriptional activator
MEFRILGQLEVFADGRRIEIGRAQQRALLAVLLLNAGEPVSTQRLIDGIWGDTPPVTADQLVRADVSQLRTLLGEGATIATRGPGYAIEVAERDLDARRFESLVMEARRARTEQRPDDALAAYEDALALWRGDVLADTPVGGDAALRASRLEKLRVSAQEERVDAALACGRHLELIPELEQRVAAQPFGERSRAQLMLALYRAGRQADALAVYQDARRFVAGGLGFQPGLELRQLQSGILRNDPLLALPGQRRERERERRRRLVRLVGAVLAATAATAIAIVLIRPSASHRSHQAGSLRALDPATGSVRASIRTPDFPATLAVGGGRVWLADASRRTLVEIDAKRLHVVRTIHLPSVPERLVYGGGALWVADGYGTFARVGLDGTSSYTFRPATSLTGRRALAFGGGSLWAGSQQDVARVDAASGRLVARVSGLIDPDGAAFGFGSLWLVQPFALFRIDARTNRVAARIRLRGIPRLVAVGAGAVWVLAINAQLWRIDPRTNAVTAAIHVVPNASGVVAGSRLVWVAGESTGTLEAVDPRTNTVVRTIRVSRALGGIATGEGRLWVGLP